MTASSHPRLDRNEGILGQPALVVLDELRHGLLHLGTSSAFLLEVQVVTLSAAGCWLPTATLVGAVSKR